MLTANGQLCHTATCEHQNPPPVPSPGKSNLLLAAVGPITQRPGKPRYTTWEGKGRPLPAKRPSLPTSE